jgi:hypothetical protein
MREAELFERDSFACELGHELVNAMNPPTQNAEPRRFEHGNLGDPQHNSVSIQDQSKIILLLEP